MTKSIPKSTHVLILGGGISGCFYAWLCQQHQIPYQLIEKEERLGGNIQTLSVQDRPLELGAHALYNSYALCIELILQLGLENEIQAKPKLPYRVKQKTFYTKILKVISFRDALVSFMTNRKLKTSDFETIQEKFTRLFGEKNYKNLLGPFFNALLNQDAREFPSALVMKKRKKNKSWPRIFSFKNGIETLIKTLEEKLSSVTLGIYADKIEVGPSGFTLSTIGGPPIHGSHLVLATPLVQTRVYLEKMNSKLHFLMQKGTSAPSLAVACETGPLHLKPLAGSITSGEQFRSFITNDTKESTDQDRSFTFHFKPMSTNHASLKTAIKNALSLKEETKVAILKEKLNLMPTLSIEAHQEMLQLEQELATNPNLYMTGNYFGGVSLEDCLQRSQEEFNRLLAHLNN
jgi:oxygen-dependent protoporphyrinogen oxidase